MKRKINIVKIKLEEYLALYGTEYDEGNLFDYPFEELDYIVNETDINNLAIIGNRLYEIPE